MARQNKDATEEARKKHKRRMLMLACAEALLAATGIAGGVYGVKKVKEKAKEIARQKDLDNMLAAQAQARAVARRQREETRAVNNVLRGHSGHVNNGLSTSYGGMSLKPYTYGGVHIDEPSYDSNVDIIMDCLRATGSIADPSVGSGSILSPSFGSGSILTPPTRSGSILSPF